MPRLNIDGEFELTPWAWEPLSAQRRRAQQDLVELGVSYAPRLQNLAKQSAINRLQSDDRFREMEEERERLEEEKRRRAEERRRERQQRIAQMQAELRERAQREQEERRTPGMFAGPAAAGSLVERFRLGPRTEDRGAYERFDRDRDYTAEADERDDPGGGFLGTLKDVGRGALEGATAYSRNVVRPIAETAADVAAHPVTRLSPLGRITDAARIGIEAPEAIYEGVTKGPRAGFERLAESVRGPIGDPRDTSVFTDSWRERERQFGERPLHQQIIGEIAADPTTYIGTGLAAKAGLQGSRIGRGLVAADRALDTVQSAPFRAVGRLGREAGRGFSVLQRGRTVAEEGLEQAAGSGRARVMRFFHDQFGGGGSGVRIRGNVESPDINIREGTPLFHGLRTNRKFEGDPRPSEFGYLGRGFYVTEADKLAGNRYGNFGTIRFRTSAPLRLLDASDAPASDEYMRTLFSTFSDHFMHDPEGFALRQRMLMENRGKPLTRKFAFEQVIKAIKSRYEPFDYGSRSLPQPDSEIPKLVSERLGVLGYDGVRHSASEGSQVVLFESAVSKLEFRDPARPGGYRTGWSPLPRVLADDLLFGGIGAGAGAAANPDDPLEGALYGGLAGASGSFALRNRGAIGSAAREAGRGFSAGLKAPVLGMVGDTGGRAGRFGDEAAEAVGDLRPGQRVETSSGVGEFVGLSPQGKAKVRLDSDGKVRGYKAENIRPLEENDFDFVSDFTLGDRARGEDFDRAVRDAKNSLEDPRSAVRVGDVVRGAIDDGSYGGVAEAPVISVFADGSVLVRPRGDRPRVMRDFEVVGSSVPAAPPPRRRPPSGPLTPPAGAGTPPLAAIRPMPPADADEGTDLLGLMDEGWSQDETLGTRIANFVRQASGNTEPSRGAVRDQNLEVTEGLLRKFNWAARKNANRNAEYLTEKMKQLSRPFRIKKVDGQWRVTNVEGSPTMADIALSPSSFSLSDSQRAALPQMKQVREELDAFERLYGVDVDHGMVEIADPEGFYWERIVTERMGEDRPVPPNIGGGSGVGSKKDFHRERRFATQEEGIASGAVYEHPLEAFLVGTRGRLKHAADSWLMQRLPEAPAGTAIGDNPWVGRVYEPGLLNKEFSPEVAKATNKALTRTGPEKHSVDWFAREVINAPGIFLGAAMDLSAIGLQGIKGIFNMPQATLKAFWYSTIHGLAGGDWTKPLQGVGKHSGLSYEEKVALGLPFEGLSDSEFTKAAGYFGFIDKATSAVTGGKVAPFRGSAEAFRRFRVLLANEMFERSVANARTVNKVKGAPKAPSQQTMRKLARDAGRSVGISTGDPKPWEKTAFFAASFFRSQFEQLGKVFNVTDMSVDAWIARKQMAQMIGLASAATVGINYAQGRETEFNPLKPHWMRIKMGDSWVSLLGPWDSFARLAVNTGGIAYNETAGSLGATPLDMPDYLSEKGILGPIRSKASPAFALGTELLTRQDFRGNPLSFPESVPGMAMERLPFSLTDTAEDIAGAGLSAGSAARAGLRTLGVKVTPESPTDKLNEVTQDGDFHNSRQSEKQRVRNENPELWEGYLDSASPETRKYYEYADELKAQRGVRDQMLLGGEMTQQEWIDAMREDSVKLAAFGRALFGDAGGPEKTTAHAEYMRMIQESTDEGSGRVDWDKVQAQRDLMSEAWNTEVDEDTDAYMGTDLTRAYRDLSPIREAYYSISKYRGYAPEEARMIDEAWDVVRSIVPPDASERDMRRAVFSLRGQYPPRVWRALRLRAFGRGVRENPMRERFMRLHPEAGLFGGQGLMPTWGAAYIQGLMGQEPELGSGAAAG